MEAKIKNNLKCKKVVVLQLVVVFAFCLMLLPFEQLSFLKGAAYADSNDLVDYTFGSDLENYNEITNDKDVLDALWNLNVAPVVDEKEQEQRDELQSLIDQLNSIELSLPESIFENEDLLDDITKTDREAANTKEDLPSVTKNDRVDSMTYEFITEQTIQKLMKMTEKIEKVDNPYEIGNTLYLSNNIGQAAAFYQESLRRSEPENMADSEDRAWLLFQTGNSLRSIDMLAAADIYGKLITEYPNSPWADYARVQSNVINWYVSDKPDELLKQNNK